MKISGAQAVIESLLAEKVEVIFGYPGGAIMPVYDALFHYRKRIYHILVRHEQGASHAAEGYARVSGKAGVCLVTSGPGATNLVTGITDAMMDSVPIVCISGQVASHLIGSDAFQEADVIGITAPITKWNYQITKASEIPQVFAKAFHIAQTGRPGPVLIDITKDAQVNKFDFHYPDNIKVPSYQPNTEANINQIKKAARILNEAKRPLMLIGHGVLISHAAKLVKEICEKAAIPAASTLHGLSALPSDFKYYVGMLGMHGNYGPNVLTNKADAILAVGMRFDDRVTGRLVDYAKKAQIIHIDIDPAELNKNVNAFIPIVADAKNALQQLIKFIKPKKRNQWITEFRKLDRIEFDKIIKPETQPNSGQIKMAEAVKLISDKTKGKAVVVADVGQHQMITARYYRFQKPDSFITSGGLGTMGFALPASIGAKLGSAKRTVIAIIGDGSFQMNIQELATIAQDKIDIKIVILNNNFLGMVRQWQQMFFEKRYSFVDLKNPDFVMVAKGFGVPGEEVTRRADLSNAIDRMLKYRGSYLLEIVVEKENNVFPMIATGAAVDEIRLE